MKSFQAKMYIEEDLATIEFDIQMTGGEDHNDQDQLVPGWDFLLIQDAKSLDILLGIYDVDSMKGVGEMSSAIEGKDYKTTKEEALKFLELYIAGRQCIKYNYIYPHSHNLHSDHTAADQIHIANKNSTDVFLKNPENNELEFWQSFPPQTLDPEELDELNQTKQAIQQNKMPSEYPDGTKGDVYDATRDQEGNFTTSPSKDEK